MLRFLFFATVSLGLLAQGAEACMLLPRTAHADVGVAQCPKDMASEIHDEKTCQHWREEIKGNGSRRDDELHNIARLEGCEQIVCERKAMLSQYQNDAQVTSVMTSALTTIIGSDAWKYQICEKQ